ncbi:MAG: hypothetical protein COT15_04605 [Candidatus Diapherotrites archaeon CG08_land_8_20_14_0_20_34_12]|nr:MAG: hypothetical protein COT15_04605 [Candidatus Diapherotrites archaeon CG08_land_8_20_14_0_20_34_12]
MTIFIDSCTLISFMSKQEKNFDKAVKIITAIENSTINAVYTDYILDEILTCIRKHYGIKASLEALDVLIASKIQMVKVEEKHIRTAIEIFRKYPKLSFTDAISVAVMIEKNIENICSFDSDFDSIPRIRRLEEIN